MGLFGLKPSRDDAKPAVIVTDLDKLVTNNVAFRFAGQTHLIKPISTKEFFEVSLSLQKMEEMKARESVTPKELVQAYADLFGAVCDTIKMRDVETMTQAQVAALFSLILECIAGKAYTDEKKNTLAPSSNHLN